MERGVRSVEVTVDVPGKTEQVWRAIATGRGLGCWFFPSELEERVGGRLVCFMAPGLEANATVVAWEPPYRFVTSSDDLGETAPPLRTEWTVEPLESGCRVHVRHGIDTDSDAWDRNLLGMQEGWPGFFRVLQLYLKHFPDREATPCCLFARLDGSLDEVWTKLAGALPYSGTTEGSTVTDDFRELLIRRDEPAAIVALNAYPAGDQVMVGFSAFHYGGPAPDEDALRGWLSG